VWATGHVFMHRCKAVKGSEKDFLVNTVTMTVTVKIRTLIGKMDDYENSRPSQKSKN